MNAIIFYKRVRALHNVSKNYVEETVQDAKSIKFVERFKAQLLTGIEYYESISNQVMENVSSKIESFKKELTVAKNNLQTIKTP